MTVQRFGFHCSGTGRFRILLVDLNGVWPNTCCYLSSQRSARDLQQQAPGGGHQQASHPPPPRLTSSAAQRHLAAGSDSSCRGLVSVTHANPKAPKHKSYIEVYAHHKLNPVEDLKKEKERGMCKNMRKHQI